MSKTNEKRKLHGGDSNAPARIDAGAVKLIVEKADEALTAEGPERVTDIVQEISAAPPTVAIEAIREIARQLRERSLPLLEALAASERSDLALAAVDALGATKVEEAAPVLVGIAEKSKSKEIRKVARRSLFRLKSVGLAAQATVQAEEPAPAMAPPVRALWKAYMTNHDGAGDQILYAAAEGPFGRLDAFNIFVNDKRGFLEFDSYDSSKRAWQRKLQVFEEPGIGIVEIPLDYFQCKVKQTYDVSKDQGTPIPEHFERWRSLLAEPEQACEQHPIYRDISVVEIKWNPELLEQSPEITKNKELISWILPPDEMKNFIEELEAIKEGKITLPSWVEKEKAEAVMNRALERFFGDEEGIRWKHRLEDMAYLLFHTDRPLHAKRALAAALALDQQGGVQLQKNPFAAALFQRSVEMILTERPGAEAEKEKLITDLSELAPYIDEEPE
ncbi:MAG: HEAT repeat domain-containing protein [Chloroflexi bacterium]|nr:HEAT repeat domain-containing protein [Chloroflexota bacterium]